MADVTEPSTVAGVLGRMAGSSTARNRIVRAFWTAGATTLRSVGRVLHMLFLEVTGFLFIILGVVGAGGCFREYQKYKAGLIGPGKAALAGCFALMFLWFGVSSFWRARRKRS